MSNLYAPFRYDYVGSFLRPAELKKARADYEAGAITADQLKAVDYRTGGEAESGRIPCYY